ncbi:AMP-binding protein [Roseomonas sp. HF4]|uniref:AMP-binding protein n=1 Tax=Roseomonas sp. HF4 TaxID=2562313 RepID=UPI0010C02D1F|nr:AMP-binding protein [Roseomonas sp. HF4]
MAEDAAAPAAHSLAMQRALARAAATGGWLATPELPWDYRGPCHVPHEAFGDAGRGRPALESLRRVVAASPDAVACQDDARTLTFHELWRATARLATLLRGSKVRGPVGILLPNGVLYPVAVLACLAAGRIAVLLDASYPEARNAELIRLTGVRLMLAAAGMRDTASACGLPFLAAEVALTEAGDPFPPPSGWMGQDMPAFVVCTSGSTGRPKAVVYSQRGLLHQAGGLIDALHLSARDRFLFVTSGATIAGLWTMFALLSGCALRLVALDDVGLQGLRAALRGPPVTVLRGGPSLFRLLARLPDAPSLLATLRVLRSTGEPLLHADVEALRAVLPPACLIVNGYGATELSGTAWVARPGDAQDTVRVAAGFLDPGTEAKIVDADGNPCPPGEVGELWLRARHAALGEWQDGRLVPGRLEPDLSDPSLRIYRSGDLARLAPDGAFVVLGRKDRMVKVKGWRVEPAEVETVLRGSPEVAGAAVIAREAGGRAVLVAFVVPVAGIAPGGLQERLRARLAAALPEAMRPARILLIEALPLLPGGKRDDAALARLLEG